LRRKQDTYRATGKSPSAIDLHRELNALKKTELSWMYALSKCAPQEALRHLDTAYAHFYRRCALKRAGKLKGNLGYPQPKTKKQGLGSFRLTGSIVVFADAIQLPRLGRLRLKERGYLPVSGTAAVKVLSATVSEQAGHWYVSIQVQQEQTVPSNTGPVVGLDLGVKALATLSDGTVIPNPRPLKRRLKTIKRLHRAVTRKHKRQQQPQEGGTQTGRSVPQGEQSASEYTPSDHDATGENQVSHRDRGPQCIRHAEEPPPGASYRGCRVCGVSSATAL
jgi:putative transposase